MTKYFQYKFTQTEKEILDIVSEYRFKITSSIATDASQDDYFSPEEKNRRGVFSEYAVSKYLNLHFNLNCDFRTDFGPDLVFRNGTTVDVKCTHHINGGIATVPWTEKKDGDIFVGCYAPNDLSFVEIFGYVKRENLINPKREKFNKNGKSFFLIPRTEIEKFIDQRH